MDIKILQQDLNEIRNMIDKLVYQINDMNEDADMGIKSISEYTDMLRGIENGLINDYNSLVAPEQN